MTPIRTLIITLVLLLALAIFKSGDIFPNYVQKQQGVSATSQSLPNLYPYPVQKENYHQPPNISAKSAIVVEVKSDITLFEKNPHTKLLPASTTKLMTALVALEKCSLEQIVTVGAVEKEPTLMGLSTGDNISVRSLLYGLLVNSGNDAAFTLAASCARSVADFVAEMNYKAREIGLRNTHFTDPAGFDDPAQFTTSRDLAKLARVAIASPIIAKIVSTKSTVVTDTTGSKTYFLENINKLLGEVTGLEGIKTGQTEGSQEVLVTQTTRSGNTIITVVLGSQDRFEESKQLIEWAFENHIWVSP